MTAQTTSRTFKDRLAPDGPKKLLALDGGGILGVLSLEFLAGIEDLLRRELDRADDFVLADYFDYIAGTSTGAIIATCLAMGMPVAKVRDFYHDHGREMFDKDWLYNRFLHRYGNENLERMLKEEIGEQTGEAEATLGSEKLRTLLMVCPPERDHRLPLAAVEQPPGHVQRPQADGLQLAASALAGRSRQHGGADILPPRGRPGRRAGFRLRRWRRDSL